MIDAYLVRGNDDSPGLADRDRAYPVLVAPIGVLLVSEGLEEEKPPIRQLYRLVFPETDESLPGRMALLGRMSHDGSQQEKNQAQMEDIRAVPSRSAFLEFAREAVRRADRKIREEEESRD